MAANGERVEIERARVALLGGEAGELFEAGPIVHAGVPLRG